MFWIDGRGFVFGERQYASAERTKLDGLVLVRGSKADIPVTREVQGSSYLDVEFCVLRGCFLWFSFFCRRACFI